MNGWLEKGMGAMDRFSREQDRIDMVERQIADRGIRDSRVLDAMRRVPRHCFVPPDLTKQAYADHPVRIDCNQTISQPYMVGVMTEQLNLRPEDRVLEIGTGSGYQTALLAYLAAEVVSIERHAPLADKARKTLVDLGYENVTVVCGDGTLGYPAKAPYDAILVTAAAPEVPPLLIEQLAPDGRLVCPTGSRDLQKLARIVNSPDGHQRTESIPCVFVPLVGEAGWREEGSRPRLRW
jgi:protein-L-isoaspartate(D-aspartate) O-methyltransferase